MKNFEQPYLSRNITEFWRRWHISLSTWLRDYLYIPLGGNRSGDFRMYRNLLITMLLGGLWHGASWNFVVWGGLHGFYLAIHKVIQGDKRLSSDRIRKLSFFTILSIIGTYVLVLFTWLFFRSTSWETTTLIFYKLIHWENSEYTMLFSGIIASYIVVTLLLDLFEYIWNSHVYLLYINSKGLKLGILSALMLITFIYMFQAEALPFIYFQF